MRTAEVTLPGLASSVPTARRFTESVLAGWGEPAAGWTAAQVVSELATNSTIHARTEFSVRVTLLDDTVTLEVRDGSTGALHPRNYSETATTGRGLRMVDTLTREWGVETSEAGKTVWARISVASEAEDDVDTLLEAFDDPSAPVVTLPTGRRSDEVVLLVAA